MQIFWPLISVSQAIPQLVFMGESFNFLSVLDYQLMGERKCLVNKIHRIMGSKMFFVPFYTSANEFLLK